MIPVDHRRPAGDFGYLALTVFFVALLLVSDIIAVKLVPLRVLGLDMVVPAGVIAYPLTFLIADVLTEAYGVAAARRTILLGFLAAFGMVLLLAIAVRLPTSPSGAPSDAFERILGTTPRIVVASFVAYLAGELSNAQVMSLMRRLTSGRALWARTIGSTLVGQALDTTIFIAGAFAAIPFLRIGGVDLAVLLLIIRSQYLVKVAVEVMGTPLVYAAVGLLRGSQAEEADAA